MIYDFLKSLACLLPEERDDYAQALERIGDKPAYVSLMPAVVVDLWPAYVLGRTAARDVAGPGGKTHICIAPLGAHDFWGIPGFEAQLSRFYADEDPGVGDGLLYGAELQEAILLNSDDIKHALSVDGAGKAQAIYAHYRFPDGDDVFFLGVADAPHECWVNIIEKYDIKCDILIDSHKGLGDWLVNVPLYEVLLRTRKRALLPELYFKGKYVPADAPGQFRLLYRVPESGRNDCESRIYAASWALKG